MGYREFDSNSVPHLLHLGGRAHKVLEEALEPQVSQAGVAEHVSLRPSFRSELGFIETDVEQMLTNQFIVR
jgi:hypothetical protein